MIRCVGPSSLTRLVARGAVSSGNMSGLLFSWAESFCNAFLVLGKSRLDVHYREGFSLDKIALAPVGIVNKGLGFGGKRSGTEVNQAEILNRNQGPGRFFL